MWSGPRNISTAMMRAWESRGDTCVCDEPLYAHYLQQSGAAHPGAAEVITHHQTDWRKVVGWLTGPVPEGKAIFYQKHMAHHLLPSVGREWLDRVTHCFLIREPKAMLASLIQVTPEPGLADTGLPQQLELFRVVRERTGQVPPVLDARDVLIDPRSSLSQLCAALDVPFTERMLAWEPGLRPTDGVWARYWYGAVEQSRGFRPYAPRPVTLPSRWNELLRESDNLYEQLFEHRLTKC